LQSLISNFDCLQIFRSYITTNSTRDVSFPNIKRLRHLSYAIFTQLFVTTSVLRIIHCPLHSVRDLVDLLDLTELAVYTSHIPLCLLVISEQTGELKLVNLEKIMFNDKFEPSFHINQFLSKVIDISPNVRTLNFYSDNTETVIRQLIPMKNINKIIYFVFNMCNIMPTRGLYHRAFLYELSKSLPNLSTISYSCTLQFLDEYPTTLTYFIQDLRRYFGKLTRVIIKLQMDNEYREESL
jgi:hypothetical protein